MLQIEEPSLQPEEVETLTKEKKKKMEVAEAKGIMEMGNQIADPKVAVVVHY